MAFASKPAQMLNIILNTIYNMKFPAPRMIFTAVRFVIFVAAPASMKATADPAVSQSSAWSRENFSHRTIYALVLSEQVDKPVCHSGKYRSAHKISQSDGNQVVGEKAAPGQMAYLFGGCSK